MLDKGKIVLKIHLFCKTFCFLYRSFVSFKYVSKRALKNSSHFSSIFFNNGNTENAQRNRNKGYVSLNPLYSQNWKTNIGKLFIGKLFIKNVRKHFLKNNKYDKIFDKILYDKLSYCCTTSVESIK